MNDVTFEEFPKIARLKRVCIITEKIDGTNGQVIVGDDGSVTAASRSCLIYPDRDNHGFAAWVQDNAEALRALGHGRHFGEWWGSGINRGYGLAKGEKRFSLFNTSRWADAESRPVCCTVTPVLFVGIFSTGAVEDALDKLRTFGSHASPGFMNPEGVIVFHVAANLMFKQTLERDEEWKGKPNG